jgi:hypothetical protein
MGHTRSKSHPWPTFLPVRQGILDAIVKTALPRIGGYGGTM